MAFAVRLYQRMTGGDHTTQWIIPVPPLLQIRLCDHLHENVARFLPADRQHGIPREYQKRIFALVGDGFHPGTRRRPADVMRLKKRLSPFKSLMRQT